MTDYQRISTLFVGAFIGVALSILGFYMLKPEAPQPDAPKSNFEVVDTYKGCDVVRWTQSNFAEYKYFLHCSK